MWGGEVVDLRVEGFGKCVGLEKEMVESFGKCARRGRRIRRGGFWEVWGGEVGDLWGGGFGEAWGREVGDLSVPG